MNKLQLFELITFFFFILVTFILAICLLLLVRLFSGTTNYPFFKEKYSPYECGFIPYDDARNRFEVHFYIVALLFVIFDVEVILILPWVVFAKISGTYGLIVVMTFFMVLGLGFLYEWKKGALIWFFN